MNYGKKGVRERQRTLNSKSQRWERKLGLILLKLFLLTCISIGIIGAATGIGMFKGIIASAPTIQISSLVPSGQASIVYDSSGNEIDRFVGSNANRIILTWEEIPDHLGKAFVAIEDERFYQHNGIDIKALFRSAYQFLLYGRTQGGSTITQQLLKNAIFTSWTSEGKNYLMKIKRKLQEQYLAIEVDKHTEKDQVLLNYMNTINCGQNTLGVGAAANRYFGKPCSELTLSECAVIASITQNPSGYNPISHPENNARRRKDCLDNMKDLGFIDQQEYDEAIADSEAVYERIQTRNTEYLDSTVTTGTYFTDALQQQIQQDLIDTGMSESMASNLVLSGGLKVYSTLDSKIQSIVDEAFSNPENFPEGTWWDLDYALTVYDEDDNPTNYSKQNMTKWFKEHGSPNFNLLFSSQEEAMEAILTYEAAVAGDVPEEKIVRRYTLTPEPQASMVIIDQSTGYVKAIVGGRGSKEGRLTLNRATGTVRQPGSTFKILSTYAPGLDSGGLTLASVFNDMPFNYDDGTPVNNTNRKYTYTIQTVRNAIIRSMNVITVKALTQITPQLGFDYLLNFGFTTLTDGTWIGDQYFFDNQQPLALGGITYGVKNIELCAAYASIANQGAYIKPKFYTQVLDADGNVLLDNTSPQSRQVIRESTAFLLTDAMVDVMTVQGGTGTSAYFNTGMAMAGKTGTTSDYKDVWFAGYTPYYTCSVWVGYDNNQRELSDKNGERTLARTLWKTVMSKIHENLPNEQFSMPNGVVRETVCSRSGKLPIPGLCDAFLTTEYFAENFIPTESCDMHFQGPICQYDGLPAAPECPFQVQGVYNLNYAPENEALWAGSSTTVNPDGTISSPLATPHCQHDVTFFANPDAQNIIIQQSIELQNRIAAAQAAAQAQQIPPPQ